ncbi:MAG TPA: hypothetical protein VFV79_03690, partial [Saprospiraceae bacterium]|nr:hypothetical protein [Saprospiraceae bacterium]
MAMKYFFVLVSCMTLQLQAQSYIPPKLAVNAGEDVSLNLPNNSTGLKVDVKGAEGKIMYRWEKFSGPEQYKISTPDKAKTKVSDLVAGTYLFTITVFDSRKTSGRDTVVIKVKGDSKNRPPFANAGPDQTIIIPANRVVLNGQGSKDPDPNGFITSYQWSLISGPTKPVIDSPNSSTTQVYNLAKGTYQFLLRVIDETHEASDRDTVIIQVKEQEYNSPVVDAGNEIIIQLPTNKAKLSGKLISADGKIRQIQWSQKEGPNQADIATADKAQTEVSNLVKGVYQFELTVTDDHKLTGKDRVTVTVLPIKPDTKNVPPTVIADDDITITLPVNSVTLSATASDAEGSVLRIQWSETSNNPNIQIANKDKLNTTASNLPEGFFQFKIVVTDKNGATGQDFITVKVDPAINKPPRAFAGDDITITLSENSSLNVFKLVGQASDEDGDSIIHFLWSKKLGPDSIAIADSAKALTEVSFLGSGVYQFEFLVTDSRGLTGKDQVIITANRKDIIPPPPPDPVPLIILASAGLTAAIVGSYFFFWWWPMKKVMVFFMHADEEAFAHSLFPGSEKTEGYLIDHANKGTIRKLTQKGIAVHVLNTTNLIINTPGKTSSFHFSLKKGRHELKSVKEEAKPGIQIRNMITSKAVDHSGEFPSFYLITLDTPLLPIFQNKLESIGLSVIQRVPENSY